MKIRFFSEYGSWIEDDYTEEEAKLRACALNVGFKIIKEDD